MRSSLSLLILLTVCLAFAPHISVEGRVMSLKFNDIKELNSYLL